MATGSAAVWVLPILIFQLVVAQLPSHPSSSPVSHHFESWCEEHGKVYSSAEEKLYRLSIFEDNRNFVEWHNNQPNTTYTLALNAFADLTHREFRASRLGLTLALKVAADPDENSNSLEVDGPLEDDVPGSLDWRAKGAVTQVKDQGSCGDCWAFSATGAIEGINKIVTGTLISLSEQELCDCDKSYNNGCNGGLMNYAFKWVIQNKGIDTEEDYPYQAQEKPCLKNKLSRHVVTIDGYKDIPPNNEKLLLQAVAKQPVSVGICGSARGFQLYSKGIFSGPCSTSLDHAVLIVGYGTENGVDYWILKNSWGKSWGMNGYMQILRNSEDSNGVCGINMLASYPTKTSPNPPPSPGPGPVKCSLLTYCPTGSTCCCSWSVFGICLSWSCCDLDGAVCCQDHKYCCPHDFPICSSTTGQCLKVSHNSTLSARKMEKSYLELGNLLQAWL